MKIFEHPNLIDFKCPICGTNDDKPITLVSIAGTEDHNKHEAKQVHVDCIELTMTILDDGLSLVLVQILEPEL